MFAISSRQWHRRCILYSPTSYASEEKEPLMDLAIWIPAMLLMGLAGLGLMCAFIIGCDKV